MTPCDHIQAQAAGLAAAPPDDAERVAAFEHARTCPACARALGEGVALFGLLELGAPALPAAPEALARAASEIRQELTREAKARGQSWRSALAVAFAVLAAWLAPLRGGLRLPGSPGALSSLLIGTAAVVATAAAMTLGTPFLAGLPLVSFVASGVAGGEGPLDAHHGLHCLMFELGVCLLPLALAFLLARRHRFAHPGLALAAAAGGGALAGQAALAITCHALQTHAHLFAFHSGGVLLALLLGAATGRVFTRNPRV